MHFARDTVLRTVGCKKIQVFSAKVQIMHLWLITERSRKHARAQKTFVFGPERYLCMELGFTQSSETECNGAIKSEDPKSEVRTFTRFFDDIIDSVLHEIIVARRDTADLFY